METKEFELKMRFGNNGFLHLLWNLILLAGSIALCCYLGNRVSTDAEIGVVVLVAFLLTFHYILHCVGFMVIQPNQSRVMTFFGMWGGSCAGSTFPERVSSQTRLWSKVICSYQPPLRR